MDCELVITAVQLNVPLPPVGQPARCDPLKCAYVSYADSPSPTMASASVVNWSQIGGPAGLAGATGSAVTAVACRFARPGPPCAVSRGCSACAPAACGLAAGAWAPWAACGGCPCCCFGAAVRAAGRAPPDPVGRPDRFRDRAFELAIGVALPCCHRGG